MKGAPGTWKDVDRWILEIFRGSVRERLFSPWRLINGLYKSPEELLLLEGRAWI